MPDTVTDQIVKEHGELESTPAPAAAPAPTTASLMQTPAPAPDTATADMVAEHGETKVPEKWVLSGDEEARGAREQATSTRWARTRATTQTKPAEAEGEGEGALNPYDKHLTGPQDDGPDNLERARLNMVNSYYRGTLAGAAGLRAMASIYSSEDTPDMSPGMIEARAQSRKDYDEILMDLMRYDMTPSWSGLPQLIPAIGGSLAGGALSPESFVGWAAKGTTWTARTFWAALQQGAISGVADPAVQALNMDSGVQKDYDWKQTVGAFFFGAAMGGGFHAAGEEIGHLIGQRELRKQLFDLSDVDPSLFAADHAIWALDPRNGISFQEPVREAPKAAEKAPPDKAAAPTTSFADVLGEEKKRLQAEHQEANKAAGERGEETKARRPGEAEYEAQVAAFGKDVGDENMTWLKENAPKDAIDKLPRMYDRAAGEMPDVAMHRAIDVWYLEREREGLQHEPKMMDDDLHADLAEAERIQAAYDATAGQYDFHYQGDKLARLGDDVGGISRGTERVLPGRSSFTYGGGVEHDIPFESQGNAGAGGRVPPGGGAAAAVQGPAGEPGGGRGVRGEGGDVRPDEAEPRPAGAGEAGGERGGGGVAGAEGARGERLTTEQLYAKVTARDLEIQKKHEHPSEQGGFDYVGYRLELDKDPEFKRLMEEWAASKAGPKTERTAEGEQTLMPGVEPITDKQRVEAQMEKPLQGGEVPPPAGGLFDEGARAQGDLLDASQELRANRAANQMPGEERRDDTMAVAVGAFSPDQKVKLQSLHQLSVNLADALDIPLRQGRMNEKGTTKDTLGIYKFRAGVIRVRELADFEVVKHEVGHAIEKKVGKELTSLTQLHTWELARLDYDQSATGQRVNEGFAEWMRYRMTNPAAAQREAPAFFNSFDALLAQRRPEILKVINETAIAHRAWLDADPVDALAAVVQNTLPDPMWAKQLAREVAEEGLTPVTNTYVRKAGELIQDQYTHYVDRFYPMEAAVRELLAQKQVRQSGGLVPFNASQDPSVLIRSLRRAGEAAQVQLRFGIIPYRDVEPRGRSLTGALNEALGSPFLGKWDDPKIERFDQYLAARMSVYLWERYDQGLIPNEPSPIKPGAASRLVAAMEQEFPSFKTAGDKINEMYQHIRQKKLDAGLWSQETFAKTGEYDFYVPMKRVMEEGAGGPGGARDASTLASGVKKRVGSERDIDSPLRNIMRDIYYMEQDIRKNDMRLAMAELSESVPGEGGKYMEELPAHEARQFEVPLEEMIAKAARDVGMDPGEARTFIDALRSDPNTELTGSMWRMEQAAARGEPIVFVWKDGKPKPYRVMSEQAKDRHRLFELMTEVPPPIQDTWSNIISFAAAGFRGGITTNPAFVAANYIKDQMQVALTQPGYIPIFGGLKGLWDELSEGAIAQKRAYAGGVMGGSLVGEVERKFEANIQSMAEQGYIIKRLGSIRAVMEWLQIVPSTTAPKYPIKGIAELMQSTEAATRNSVLEMVYKQKLKQGLSPYEALIEAARRSDDTMDFGRNGDRMQWVRKNVPFLNANIVGIDRYLFRQMAQPFMRPVLTVADREARNRALYSIMMAGGGGIAVGMAWAAINSEKEVYRDAIPEVKGTHVIIPGLNGEVALWPKPFEMAFGFTIGEYAYAALAQKDPRAAANLATALAQTVSPPNPIENMPLVTPTIELMTNHSFFRKGPIVPDQNRNAGFPELEYNEKTSSLAKYLGKQLSWSPMKIDYAAGAYFGSNGRDFMSASSLVDKDSPTAALDDTVILRRFIKNEERISGRTKQFWQLMGQKNGKYTNDAEAYRKLVTEAVRAGQPPTVANQLLAKLPEPEQAFVVLKEGADRYGKPAFKVEQRMLHPLVRAHEAATVLNAMAIDLQNNAVVAYREKEKIPLDPDQRRKLIDDVRTLAGAEMRNAFAITGEPGYQGRQVFDVNDYMDVIRKVSPAVADEIATRYATSKIPTTKAVQEIWPRLKSELVRYGTNAEIRSVAGEARVQGYEFAGHKAKKPGPIRVPIVPTAPAAVPAP